MDLQLDAVREELSGLWDWTRAQFWITAAQGAVRDEAWEAATRRLVRLADALSASPSGSAAWKQLACQALQTAIRARSPALVEEVSNRTLENAWPSGGTPYEIVEPLRVADRTGALQEGLTLGRLLERRYPSFGWAPYAAAHFAERLCTDRPVALKNPGEEVRRFEDAARLFEAANLMRAAGHSRLRAATLRMIATPQTERAREMLRGLDPDELDDAERRWYALAQAHSPFWLDRVRAADYVGDQFDRLGAEDQAVVGIAETLFTGLPVQLAPAEVDRLRDLAASFEGDARWELEAQIRGREAAEAYSDTPLEELDPQAARDLEDEALPLDGFGIIVEAFQGGRPEDRPIDDIAARVVDALVALQHDDGEDVADVLSSLARSVESTRDGRRLRPVALVFPVACAAELDEATEHLNRICALYAERAPRPSYGFGNLAAVLFDAGLWEAGARVTRRALDEGESVEPRRMDAAVARSIQWAVRDGSDREMLEWLEIGEARFSNEAPG